MESVDWGNFPECLIGEEPIELSTFGTGVALSLGRSMSNAVDRSVHTPHSLTVFLNTRVYAGRQAHKRSRNWWGRFYNKYSGDHAHYIKLKGIHLIQVLKVAEKVPTDLQIPHGANCALRLDIAEKILASLKKQLAYE